MIVFSILQDVFTGPINVSQVARAEEDEEEASLSQEEIQVQDQEVTSATEQSREVPYEGKKVDPI